MLIGSACRGAPGPDEWPESYRELGLALDAAEEAGDLDEVNRLEAWMWLDGPSAPEGRVTGAGPRPVPGHERPGPGRRRPRRGDRATVGLGRAGLRSGCRRWSSIGDLDLEDIRETSEGLAERIPGATLEVLEGTAHLPQLEGHPRCLEAISDFLS